MTQRVTFETWDQEYTDNEDNDNEDNDKEDNDNENNNNKRNDKKAVSQFCHVLKSQTQNCLQLYVN